MPVLLGTSSLTLWPLAVAVLVLVAAAALNHGWWRIPNQFTLGAIAAAWFTALAFIHSGVAPTAGGGISSSVASTFVALFALLPLYMLGFLPAGCVKTQMAFGAWVGCALPISAAWLVVGLASVGGMLVTAAIVSVYQLRQSAAAKTAAGSSEPIDVTKPPEMFPLQTTLSLGSILGLVATLVFAAGRLAG